MSSKEWFNENDKYHKWKRIENPWKFNKSWYRQLLKQSGDDFTREAIKKIIETPIKSDYKQRHPLKINRLDIWLNPFSPYNSLGTIQGAFNIREHAKVKGFPSLKDKLVLDIGANEGFYLLYLKKKFPKLKIIAVEPDPISLKILKRNIKANHLKNITVIESAVTDRIGKVNFEVIPTDTAVNSIKIEKKPWMRKGIIKRISVKSITIPYIFEKYKIKKIDLLKVDTEGSEVKILNSARPVMSCIPKIVVEHHSKKLHQGVKNILKKSHKLVRDENTRYGNSYFIRK